MLILKVLAAWFIADFISGLAHWAEDRLLKEPEENGLLHGVYIDNVKHHKRPGYLILESWWGNINTSAPLAWPLAFGCLLNGRLVIGLAFTFAGFGNLVHRWAHEIKAPWIVEQLQRTGIFLSFWHHAEHHQKDGVLLKKEEARDRYCVMTDYLNPVLDGIGFWRRLERIFL